MHKPKIRRNFLQLLKLSLKHYFEVLKASWLFIILLVVVKDLSPFFYYNSESLYMALGASAVLTLLVLFFWTCSLKATDNFFGGHRASIHNAFSHAGKAFLNVFFAFLSYAAIFIIFLLFQNAVAKNSIIFEFILFLMPVLFLFVLFYFAIPGIIIHKFSVIRAFRASSEMVGFQNWFHTFGLYAMTLFVWFLVSPNTLHEHILANYYLNVPFDVIALIICVPILNAMVVLSDNDFRL